MVSPFLSRKIEAGKVALVLTKDMSRLSRNYLQTDFYTEVLFRKFGVCFIAIRNSIDSDGPSSSEFAPFVNIMSRMVSEESEPQAAHAIWVKGESGKPPPTAPSMVTRKTSMTNTTG